MDIVIQVNGMEELIKKCNDPALIGEPMRGFFEQSTLLINDNVRMLTPVDRDTLRGSIKKTVDVSPMPMWGKVDTNRIYAEYVEEDTKPHWIGKNTAAGQAIALWARRHGISAYLVRRKIGLFGTKGKHMFLRGAQNSMSSIEGFLKQAAEAIEERWGAK